MSPYRRAAFRRAAARPLPVVHAGRCESCGLELLEEDVPDGLSLGAETILYLARKRWHGGDLVCPGPPALELPPWWRAVLELVVA